MRLLVTMRAEKSFCYDANYFNKLQGFVYNVMRNSPHSGLHDKKGSKFFCFSNIFPGGKNSLIEEGSLRSFILSSPDRNFVSAMKESLDDKKEACIGEMLFSINSVKELNIVIKENCVVKTSTPIIIRIPQYMYEEYGISSQRSYEFWKPEHDFNAFLKQMSENIIKKYNEYYKEHIEEQPLFQQFVYDGSYPVHPIINHKEQTFVGSYWKFIFSCLTKEQLLLLNFAIDCGFGELNSMGFGFVNVVK